MHCFRPLGGRSYMNVIHVQFQRNLSTSVPPSLALPISSPTAVVSFSTLSSCISQPRSADPDTRVLAHVLLRGQEIDLTPPRRPPPTSPIPNSERSSPSHVQLGVLHQERENKSSVLGPLVLSCHKSYLNLPLVIFHAPTLLPALGIQS